MAKMSNNSGKSKIPTDAPVNCNCGTAPVLKNTQGVITKSPYIEYECPNCHKKSPMRWLPSQSAIAIATWNNYILNGN